MIRAVFVIIAFLMIAGFASAQTQPEQRAAVQLRVPADAKVWFDGRLTKQTGSDRTYTFLMHSETGFFTIKIYANGTEQTHRVNVWAGYVTTLTALSPAVPMFRAVNC